MIFIKIYNYLLCKKYPFYKTYNAFSGRFCGYNVTWYDNIPIGWRKAFGKKLSKDLRKQLKKEKVFNTFRITDIKEKYGTLRIDSNICSDKIDDILQKYELLSMCYCINCGKPTKYITNGWIYYLCEDCAKEGNKDFKQLNADDIPCVYKYKDNKIYKCTTYGINYFKIWNIIPDDYVKKIKQALDDNIITREEFEHRLIWLEKTINDTSYIDLIYDDYMKKLYKENYYGRKEKS